MSKIRYYTDEHVAKAVIRGLRQRGVNVLTTPEAKKLNATDEEHLTFAFSEKRVIFTQDNDFLRLASSGKAHAGYSMPDQNQLVTLMGLRTRAGLTRREVATALGVTEKTIYVWETSENPPKITVAQVQQLLELLDCTLDELVIATAK